MYSSRELEYLAEDVQDQQMLYLFVILCVIRWALLLFATNHIQLSIDKMVRDTYGYIHPGHGLTTNRTKLNQQFGWVSLFLGDYIVIHYFVYCALYKFASDGSILMLFSNSNQQNEYQDQNHIDIEQFYYHQELALWFYRITQIMNLIIAILFYTKFVRKEITFLNFII